VPDKAPASRGSAGRRTAILILPALCLTSAFLLLLALHHISTQVRAACSEAASEFDGDCVEALAAYVESEHHTYQERNHAIWALGEIGDRRALPTLERLLGGELSGSPCDTSRGICRYSVEKAIELCRGLNIVQGSWRSGGWNATILVAMDAGKEAGGPAGGTQPSWLPWMRARKLAVRRVERKHPGCHGCGQGCPRSGEWTATILVGEDAGKEAGGPASGRQPSWLQRVGARMLAVRRADCSHPGCPSRSAPRSHQQSRRGIGI